MQDRTAGHPLGALLIIVAIFSVALAFSVATPPGPSIAVNVAVAVTAPTAPVPESTPEQPAPVVVRAAASPARIVNGRGAGPSLSAEALRAKVEGPADKREAVLRETPAAPAPVEMQAPAGPEPLAAFSWPAWPSPYPAATSPVSALTAVRGAGPSGPAGGAVTHALTSAGAAVKSAFRKTF